MGVAAVLDWMVQDGERLANCRHDHPFAVLGPQPSDQGWTVRMWMPDAQSVTLLQAGEEIAMTTPNHPWVFEAQVSRCLLYTSPSPRDRSLSRMPSSA